jgi:short-subunit dehydrogenase
MQDFYEKYGEWALVTGASSGIGLEFAKQTAAKGLNVVLVARRKGRLEKIAKQIEAANSVQTRIVVADLTEAAGISAVIEETQDLMVGLLVNNAGREDSGHFLKTPVEIALNTIDLNVKAPLQLTHHFARLMRERNKGGLIFMSSIVAFQGVPYIANYAATKAYDLAFAEGVAAELKQSNIDVTAVTPGFTRSELSPDFNFDGLPFKPMAPEIVVSQAIQSLGRSRISVPGIINKFLFASGKYIQPRWLNTKLFGNVFSRVLRFKLVSEPEEASG